MCHLFMYGVILAERIMHYSERMIKKDSAFIRSIKFLKINVLNWSINRYFFLYYTSCVHLYLMFILTEDIY